MSNINKINANGTNYDIEDSTAREQISNLNLTDYMTLQSVEITIPSISSKSSMSMSVSVGDGLINICGYEMDNDNIFLNSLYFTINTVDNMRTIVVKAFNNDENSQSAYVTVYFWEVKE